MTTAELAELDLYVETARAAKQTWATFGINHARELIDAAKERDRLTELFEADEESLRWAFISADSGLKVMCAEAAQLATRVAELEGILECIYQELPDEPKKPVAIAIKGWIEKAMTYAEEKKP